jgi:hypothetical protein
MKSEYERFWAKVGEPDKNGCWPWNASKDRKGYGQFRRKLNNRWTMYKAHRYMYEKMFSETIEEGLCVCHACDNPSCVSPYHLFLGTNKDNIDDKIKKGRHNWGITSKITANIAEEIRNTTGTNKELAKKFGISPTQISYIRHNKRWKPNSKEMVKLSV